MLPLTKRQREILDFLNEFIQQHGYAPSLEEIGRRFGLSSLATVHKHLTNLQEKGFIRRAWNRSRSVEMVPTRGGGRSLELPLLGFVAAGVPASAIDGADRVHVMLADDAAVDGVLEPEQVAQAVVAGLADERFLILPHPQVAEYFRRKAADYDRWLHQSAEGSLALQGRKIFLKYRCVSCHSADAVARVRSYFQRNSSARLSPSANRRCSARSNTLFPGPGMMFLPALPK